MKMKLFFRRIHLYLSLSAGLVILIACATGALLVFEKDLQMSLNKSRYFVKPSSNKMTLEELGRKVQQQVPNSKISSIKVYDAADRSVEINITVPEKKVQKKGAGSVTNLTAFVNPYTGQLLEAYNYRKTFFYKVFALHRWLLGDSKSIGKYIVGIATFIFLFILITGIILWWPKTRNILVQRLKIKQDGGWKRLNHDLHIVLGFYSAIFLFVFAFTGLAWSFEWFNKGIYKVTSSPMAAPPIPKSIYNKTAKPVSTDHALAAAKTVYPEGNFYSITHPKDSIGAITVSVLSNDALHEGATHAVYIDQYAATVLGRLPFSERSPGAKVRSTFKPIHTGSIGGTPSKIVAFVVCLLGVSFPITGTIMWWNRTRKKKRSGSLAANKKHQLSEL